MYRQITRRELLMSGAAAIVGVSMSSLHYVAASKPQDSSQGGLTINLASVSSKPINFQYPFSSEQGTGLDDAFKTYVLLFASPTDIREAYFYEKLYWRKTADGQQKLIKGMVSDYVTRLVHPYCQEIFDLHLDGMADAQLGDLPGSDDRSYNVYQQRPKNVDSDCQLFDTGSLESGMHVTNCCYRIGENRTKKWDDILPRYFNYPTDVTLNPNPKLEQVRSGMMFSTSPNAPQVATQLANKNHNVWFLEVPESFTFNDDLLGFNPYKQQKTGVHEFTGNRFDPVKTGIELRKNYKDPTDLLYNAPARYNIETYDAIPMDQFISPDIATAASLALGLILLKAHPNEETMHRFVRPVARFIREMRKLKL